MLKKSLLALTLITSLNANNSISIEDKNKKLTIAQKSKQYGQNSIMIGNNNQHITITQQINVIDSSNTMLRDIKSALKDAQQNQEAITEKFQTLLQDNNTQQSRQIQALKEQFQTFVLKHQLAKDNIKNLESNIDQLIASNESEIKKLKNKISHMQTDITFLMQEFKKGNLSSLSFCTLHIDGVYLDSTFYKGAGIGYERLYNSTLVDEGMSLITNLSILSGTEDSIIQDEDKLFYLFDIGLKKPFSTDKNTYSTYGKSSLGYLWGDENSLYIKLGLGVEKYNKKNKISLDLNYMGIFEKEDKIITRHLLGNAQVTNDKKYQSALGLTLNISFTGF